jgi:protein-serine/threonine kinase
MLDPDIVKLDDFTRISTLGSGAFGDVYLVKHIKTDTVYAMKCLNKEKIKKKITRAQTEYKILLNSHHPFVSTLQFCFQTQLKLYIVMQYCAGGNFYDVIKRQPNKCLSEQDTKFYISCILLALEYLHFNGIVHRDVKLENILMHGSGHIMLTDFDLSICCPCDKVIHRCIKKKYSHGKGICSEPNIRSKDQLGTPIYMPPEVVVGKIYGPEVDWWSYGILIFEMLYGVPPFEGKTINDTLNLVTKCNLEFPKHTPLNCKLSSKLKHLIKKLLVHDPSSRLGYNGGATEIKDHPYFKGVEFQLLKNQKPPIIPTLSNNIDHHYFTINNYKNDTIEDSSEMINPKMLKDTDIWKVFENINNCIVE